MPTDILENAAARSALYIARSLTPELTVLKVPAFPHGLRIANLDARPLSECLLGDELKAIDAEKEISFKRRMPAHDELQRMEAQLRHFIDVS